MKMQISTDNVYSADEADRIHKLYSWLKEEGLSAEQAINLLNQTKEVIVDARHEESKKIML